MPIIIVILLFIIAVALAPSFFLWIFLIFFVFIPFLAALVWPAALILAFFSLGFIYNLIVLEGKITDVLIERNGIASVNEILTDVSTTSSENRSACPIPIFNSNGNFPTCWAYTTLNDMLEDEKIKLIDSMGREDIELKTQIVKLTSLEPK